MRKKKRRLSVFIMVILILTVGMAGIRTAEGYAAWQQDSAGIAQGIATEIIRFHVRANSDSEADQQLKLQVKDRVVTYMEPLLRESQDIEQSRQILEEQTENKTLKKSIAEVLTNIEKGNSLADAMRGESHVFPPMLINMVEAGESSGNLEMAFSRMAEQFEKEAKLKATVRKATVYPIVLIFACIGVIGVMLLYVIPIFIDMFKEIDMEMPAFTMFVMGLSEWAGTHVYIIVGVAVAIFAAYQAYYRTEGGRKNIDRIKMKMPLFGQLVVKSNCSRFARTASTLLAAGVPMIDCLDIVSRIVNNIHYSMAIQNAREEVMKGIPLSEPLRDAGIFPPMVYHMTGIGEETGNIEQMLNKLADYYDEEVEITTQTILAAMEPLIIVFMAVVVGSLVVASILPIAAMYEGLDNL